MLDFLDSPLPYPPSHIFPFGRRVRDRVPYVGMHTVPFGDIELYRPRPDSRSAFGIELAKFVSKRNLCGRTTDTDRIRKSLTAVLNYLADVFTDCVSRLASRDLATFLLYTDEQWGAALRRVQDGRLPDHDAQRYFDDGPIARRAAQYVLERIVQAEHGELPKAPKEDVEWLLDRLVLCGEWMVDLTGCYTLAVRLLPGAVEAEIDRRNRVLPIRYDVVGDLGERYRRFAPVAENDSYYGGCGWGWSTRGYRRRWPSRWICGSRPRTGGSG